MELSEMLMDFFPAIESVFRLGFIPERDEIHEFSNEQYDSYHRQGGLALKPLYTVIPKNYKYLTQSDEVDMLTEADVEKLMRVTEFLREYTKNNGCKSDESDEILKCAAKLLPKFFTDGTKFERPAVRVLKEGDNPLTTEEEWSDLIAHALGKDMVLKIELNNQIDNTSETKILSIKKHR
jgi:hypothetical protein